MKSSSYKILSEKEIPEYRSRGIWMEHSKTGCQVFHLANDDPENLFAFVFKTVPEDSTGLPHIMEHSVLSGSERFPLKDPFAVLLKSSMHTFLNAMTYPDKTMYPASTTVKKDFFNLMSVYGDAVFFPLLNREVFDQEGYRVVLDENNTLSLTGIVYNEMKGNYGNHESIAAEWSYRSLFSQSPYKYDSGGDPDCIPDLTYEQFLAFHETFYHPSNCKIFLYGDIPTEETAEFLDTSFLSRFEKREVPPSFLEEPAWDTPKFFKATSPLSNGRGGDGASTIMINWLLPRITDRLSTVQYNVLTEILLGNSGSPLRKAIVDSTFGEDLSPVSGLEADLLNLALTVGIRGSRPEHVPDFEKLVTSTLKELAEQNIPEDIVAGSLHKVEFRDREIPGRAPFGLRLLGKAMKGWLHGISPFEALDFTSVMAKIKDEAAADPAYFSRVIRESLLENGHRTTVLIQPDRDHSTIEEEKLKQRIDRLEDTLSSADKTAIRQAGNALKKFQERKEDPKVLDALPHLELKDLPSEVEHISLTAGNIGETPVFTHEAFSNGIVYLDFAFDISDVEHEDELFLPLLSRAVTKTGLKGKPYDRVARELALLSGGFHAFCEVGALPEPPDKGRSFLFFRLKALKEKIPEAADLAIDLMLHADLSDEGRLRELILEMRNDLKSQIIPRGNVFSLLRASSYLSPVSAKEERLRGISQLLHLQSLADDLESGTPRIAEKLQRLRDRLVNRSRLTIQVTGDADIQTKTSAVLSSHLDRFPPGMVPGQMAFDPVAVSGLSAAEIGEYIPLPGTVGYSAMAFPAARLGDLLHPHQNVLGHILSTEYLWERVRMRGGAYGSSAGNSGTDGLFTFSSYRDPRFSLTPRIFRESLETFAKSKIDEKPLHRAVIGVVGSAARPMTPGIRGFVGLRRLLYGITDELRQQNRDGVLSITAVQLAKASAAILENSTSAVTVIAGPEGVIDTKQVSLTGTKRTEISL